MHKTTKTSRVIAFILSLVMLIGVLPLQAFADDGIKLKNGTAKITADMTTEQVNEAIFNALVENSQGKDPQSVKWEYGCTGDITVCCKIGHTAVLKVFQAKNCLHIIHIRL